MKRKLISLICFFVILCNTTLNALAVTNNTHNTDSQIWDGTIADSYGGGSGTSSDPYQIRNAKELAYFKKSVNDGNNYKNKYFEITSDIYLNDVSDFDNWDKTSGPQNKWDGINNFAGTIDGGYHTIYGMYNVSTGNAGFFNKLGSKVKVTVNNLNFDKCYVAGSSYVSMIVGQADYIYIDDCTVNGKVSGTGNYVAGFVGYSGSGGNMGTSITNSTNNAAITGTNYVAGFIGYSSIGNSMGSSTSGNGSEKIVLKQCINKGPVNGVSYTGGFAGYLKHSMNCGGLELKYLSNENAVTASTSYGGGITGYLYAEYVSGDIEQCLNKADITVTNNCGGGIAGEMYSTFTKNNVKNCYNLGNVSARQYGAGIIGCSRSGTFGGSIITFCHNTGHITTTT